VLHEPVVTGHFAGNALGWMDWMVLMILFYIVYLGSYGIPGLPEVSAAEPERVDEVFDDHAAGTETGNGTGTGAGTSTEPVRSR